MKHEINHDVNQQINLQLTSTTLSRSELEAGLSLIRAFFPEGKVWIKEPEDTNNTQVENQNKATEVTGVIEVEVAYPEHPHCVYSKFSTEIENYVRSQSQTQSQSQSRPILKFQNFEINLNSQDIKRILSHPQAGKETERKVLLKHGIFHLLTQVTRHTPPWGILTGIRPSKILHRLSMTWRS